MKYEDFYDDWNMISEYRKKIRMEEIEMEKCTINVKGDNSALCSITNFDQLKMYIDSWVIPNIEFALEELKK